jgi:uncharacterized protein involved in type VI secretion and phage assembly
MGQMKGIVTGQVVSTADPDGQGRVQVSFPYLGGENQSTWAPVATLMAGKKRGSWFMPLPGDEVLVAFNQDDVGHPYIIGYLWNGEDTPPETDVHVRVIRSLNGHEIRIYDPEVEGGDTGFIRIQYSRGGGQANIVELANGGITIRSDTAIQIEAPSVIINGRLVIPSAGNI